MAIFSLQSLVKVLVTAVLIVIISEVSKKSTQLAAFVASLPLTSFLAILWMHWEKQGALSIANFSFNIIFYIIPSFIFFISLSWLLKNQWTFWPSIAISCLGTFIAYLGLFKALNLNGT